MPRPERSFEEGRIYHVYNKVAGGEMAFEDASLATVFVDLLTEVTGRDEVAVLGWCLLGNHYHLILRQGRVPLSLSMKSIQQGVATQRNRRAEIHGPLWQGRFKAKEVRDEDYLRQLVAYVHLNPVKAGLVQEADDYVWSGHREVIGRMRKPIVKVDDVLLLFGQTRRQALHSYRQVIVGVEEEEWSGSEVGLLPWWRLGRSPKDEELMRSEDAFIDELGRSTAEQRPQLSAAEWVRLAAKHLRVDVEVLRGRGRDPRVVRCRELLGTVGVETFGVGVGELASLLDKSRDGVWRWQQRGRQHRNEDPEFAAEASELEKAVLKVNER